MRYLAICGVVIGLAGCGKDKVEDRAGRGDPTKVQVEQLALRKLAMEAYPMWAQKHPTDTCPGSIEDLGADAINDAWGRPRKWLCDDKAFTAQSAGPDGEMDTADDVRSAP